MNAAQKNPHWDGVDMKFPRSASRRMFLSGACASASLAALARSTTLKPFSFGAQDSAERRAALASDPLRPQFHLLPAANWMNDPNGPIFWKGNYHMFFQYNPNAAVWGDMHWAHSVSPDMIHWKHLPGALAPSTGGPDQDGCFTGSAANVDGTPTIIYTAVKSTTPELATLRDGTHNFRETQCIATSVDPQLLRWDKTSIPILQPPQDPLLTGFRDPFFWKEGDFWYLGVGSGIKRKGGQVLLYRSRNLRVWESVSVLTSGNWNEKDTIDLVDSGEMWECPDFFPLGSNYVFLYSTERKVFWQTGELDKKEMTFHPAKTGFLDSGAYYAPKTQASSKGERILWGWIPERRPEAEFSKAGWAGCMSLPRILSLDSNGNLEMRVAPEAKMLREKASVLPSPSATSAARLRALRALQINNLSAEINLHIRNEKFFLSLMDGARVFLQLVYDPSQSEKELRINSTSAPFFLTPGEKEVEISLFLDGSVAEVFANNRACITARLYEVPIEALRLEIEDSAIEKIAALQVWKIKPISADRLTS
jgi:beta-fructofuranosidase